MIRLDFLILGYLEVYIKEEDCEQILNRFLKRGLSAKLCADGMLRIPFIHKAKYLECLKGSEYLLSEPKGILGFLYKERKRFGIFTALSIVLILGLYLNDFVWDIRIEGNESKTSLRLLEAMSDSGLEVGARWSKLSLNKVESEILDGSDELAWININRMGTVAFVTIKEKEMAPADDNYEVFSNIVADFDCIIEEITVNRGFAAVKPGDAVKAGDLLISGIINNENGVSFCHAEGRVVGRLVDNIQVNVSKTEEIPVYENEVLRELSIKFFNYSINIFKNYRNLPDEYVIIKENERAAISDNLIFPISVEKKYSQAKSLRLVEYTDDELVSVAFSRMITKRALKMAEAEVLSMKTSGGFTDEGYSLVCSMQILKEVGKTKPLE